MCGTHTLEYVLSLLGNLGARSKATIPPRPGSYLPQNAAITPAVDMHVNGVDRLLVDGSDSQSGAHQSRWEVARRAAASHSPPVWLYRSWFYLHS